MLHFFALLSTFLLLCQCDDEDWPISLASVFVDPEGGAGGQFTVNLHRSATIKAGNGIEVCFQEYIPVAYRDKWGPDTCTVFFNFTEPYLPWNPGYSNATFSLRNVPHYWAARPTVPRALYPVRFLLSVDGAVCQQNPLEPDINTFFNGTHCTSHVDGLIKEGDNKFAISNPKESEFWFKIYMPQKLTSFTLSSVLTDHGPTNMILRHMATPSSEFYDAEGHNITVPYPAPGIWFGRVDALNATSELIINLTTTACPEGFTGSNCDIKVIPVTPETQLLHEKISQDEVKYYSYNSTEEALWVTVRRAEDDYTIPEIYIGYNQIPTSEKALSKGCNQQYCVYVTSFRIGSDNATEITLNNSTTWFVGVKVDNFTSGVGKYGIWFGGACPSGCVGARARCGDDNETGVCHCRYGWFGMSCEEAHYLPATTVSGIILGALFGAALIFACIAKYYMYSCSNVYD